MSLRNTLAGLSVIFAAGCVTISVPLTDVEPPVSVARQQAAQQSEFAQPTRLALKRKLAVARLSNETNYGRSLLSDAPKDRMAEKVSDMFIQGLTNSGNYLIFERADLDSLKNEAELTGDMQNLVGVDTLIVGSLTEFGRSTTGKNGFFESSKKQAANATIDLRLVDVHSGQVIYSITGSGQASTETQNVMGFGSVAGYDGSINDQAIAAAVNSAVNKLDQYMLEKPWTADVLAVEGSNIFISGGRSQGLRPGMELNVYLRGTLVKSSTTGAMIRLPGEKVAMVRVVDLFGDTELEEGAITQVISGSIQGMNLADLEVKEVR